jgi:hypothetical protein
VFGKIKLVGRLPVWTRKNDFFTSGIRVRSKQSRGPNTFGGVPSATADWPLARFEHFLIFSGRIIAAE